MTPRAPGHPGGGRPKSERFDAQVCRTHAGYLSEILGCSFVDYHVREPGGGMQGLNELDVVGLNLKTQEAVLCEVTTHITGLQYGTYATTVEKIRKKAKVQRDYAKKFLGNFRHHRFMFWSPRVPVGFLTTELPKIQGLELVINEDYTECVDRLQAEVKKANHDTGNPAFRILQILGHLRR